MALLYKIWKKYNEIQITIKVLNNRKKKNHPASPGKKREVSMEKSKADMK